MEPITLTNTEEILELLKHVSLHGNGFSTECLLLEVMDAGLSDPDYLNASGTDTSAHYKGEANAWSNYHVRQSKKVFMVYGGGGVRRMHVADTP